MIHLWWTLFGLKLAPIGKCLWNSFSLFFWGDTHLVSVLSRREQVFFYFFCFEITLSPQNAIWRKHYPGTGVFGRYDSLYHPELPYKKCHIKCQNITICDIGRHLLLANLNLPYKLASLSPEVAIILHWKW